MTIEELIESLPAESWLATPELLIPHRGSLHLSKEQSKKLLDVAAAAIGQADSQKAASHLYAGLLLDETRFLADIQKRGSFRCSRLRYDSATLVPIVTSLLSPGLGLSDNVISYLNSVLNLYRIALYVREDYDHLRNWLDEHRESGLKALLAWVDFLFLKKAVGFHESNKIHLSSRHPYFFSVEQLAEGYSSILSLYGNEFGGLSDNCAIEEVTCDGDRCITLLSMGAHLATFRHWEFRVDRIGSRVVTTVVDSEYRVEPQTYELLRATELGLIQVQMQRAIKTIDWLEPSEPSIDDFSTKMMMAMENAGLVRLIEHPTPRIRFDFPKDALVALGKIGQPTKEERIALLQASRDLLTPIEQLLRFELDDGLTLGDLFKVSRLFRYLRSLIAAKLLPEVDRRPLLFFQSLIPAFTPKGLIDIIATVVGAEKASAAVKLWTSDILRHVDIQYRPFLPMQDAILVPANILSNSDVFRNALQAARIRLYEDGQVDPLSLMLYDAFQKRGISSRHCLEYDQGEIDLLVFMDGIVFALECKNSLLPTDVHEAMTSFDHIDKAAAQLSRLRSRFSDLKFREWLAEETGWPINETTTLATASIVSNRMFMGMRIDGHAVRGAHEFIHFVEDGTVSMGDETRHYWLGNELCGNDLLRYLQDDITYLPVWESMKPWSEDYRFTGCRVLVDRLYLDNLELADRLGFLEARQGLVAQQEAFSRDVLRYSIGDDFRERLRLAKQKADRKERQQRQRTLDRKLKRTRGRKGSQ